VKIAFMLGQFPLLSETFILDQITGLIDRGHDVSILAERPSQEATIHPTVASYRLREITRYEALPASRIERVLRFPATWRPDLPGWRALNIMRWGVEAASLRLAWAASTLGGGPAYDIVQCHFGALGRKAVLLRAIGALSGRIVTAFHGEDITCYPHRFRTNVYAPLFALGDLFLPISDRWNPELRALGCPPARTRVHRMGVDIGRYPWPREPIARDRPLRILSVARLVEKKGIADAVHAVARLAADCEYLVIGDGPMRHELEIAARDLGIAGRVCFLGPLPQDAVIAQLCSADIFLAPSVTAKDGDIEGIPVVLMEAMACRLPVVSTRHSAIPELVADGISGFLVGEHDVDGLADRLARLTENPDLRRRMGVAGREAVAREFAVSTLNRRLEEMYRELLKSDPAVQP
jgi:colanic acid/amylovoran biosynthesis glycosyltransferase